MNLGAKGKWEAQAVSKLEGRQVELGPGVGTILQHLEELWTMKENVWDFTDTFSGRNNRRLHTPWNLEIDKNMALLNPVKKFYVYNIAQY